MKSILAVFILVFLFSISLTGECYASPQIRRNVKRGNTWYNKSEYEKAIEEYKQALSRNNYCPITNYNIGSAFYKLGDYKNAMEHLNKVLTTDDTVLAQRAYYNLANTEYILGASKEDIDLQGAVRLLEESVRHYEQSIAIDDNDDDALHNHEFVKRELERMRQKLNTEKQDRDQRDSSKEEASEKDSQAHRQDEKETEDAVSQEKDQEAGDMPDDSQKLSQDDDRAQEEGHEEIQKPHKEHLYPEEKNIPEITAQALLDDYLRNEEPRKIYSARIKPKKEMPADRDW
jgi:Ca-activated chloride channel homolog